MAISTTNSFGSSLLIATFKIFENSLRHKRLYLLVEGIITSPILKLVIQKISAKWEREIFGLMEESAKFLFGEENYSHKRAILSETCGEDGGYILANACEVPIDAKFENILAMKRAIAKYGWYRA